MIEPDAVKIAMLELSIKQLREELAAAQEADPREVVGLRGKIEKQAAKIQSLVKQGRAAREIIAEQDAQIRLWHQLGQRGPVPAPQPIRAIRHGKRGGHLLLAKADHTSRINY